MTHFIEKEDTCVENFIQASQSRPVFLRFMAAV
jgi:hypothetical protein